MTLEARTAQLVPQVSGASPCSSFGAHAIYVPVMNETLPLSCRGWAGSCVCRAGALLLGNTKEEKCVGNYCGGSLGKEPLGRI